jgi:hypothetical protein
VSSSLAVLLSELRSFVGSLDAERLGGADAARLCAELAAIKRVAAAGETLTAARVAATGAWRSSGARSEADWLARATGATVGRARETLATGERLAALPATDRAFRAGRLSEQQAGAIASAGDVSPASEELLLQTAALVPVGKLRDQAARLRQQGSDVEARHAQVHRARCWRRWTDPVDGARCGTYELTPEAAAVLEAAATPFVEAAYRRARDAGGHEPSEAYAADGLVAMAAAVRAGDLAKPAGSRWPKGETILLVNLESLQRGATARGERCEIAGVGPVPVATARRLLGESLLKVVVARGRDIRTVVHTRRHPTREMLTALLARDGGTCLRPSCDRPVQQIDHTADWADTKVTRLDELGGCCAADHRLKTSAGHTYRHGARGWEWHRPDGVVEYEHPPPDGGGP